MRVSTRRKLQFRGLAADPDINGQFPQPFQNVQQSRLGGKRDGDDDEIDALGAGVLGQFADLADLAACDIDGVFAEMLFGADRTPEFIVTLRNDVKLKQRIRKL